MATSLFFGLGNPGEAYRDTYHNAGAIAAEIFAGTDATFTHPGREPFNYVKAGRWIIARPERVFMNESGDAVRAALRYFKLSPRRLIVAHDETDLPLGTCRVGTGSGSAGHRGVASVIETLGTKAFCRLRIGVRPVAAQRAKAGDFVLKKMTNAHRALVEDAMGAILVALKENENPWPAGLMPSKGTFTSVKRPDARKSSARPRMSASERA